MDKSIVLDKWVPPIIAGVMTGLVAVASNVWLIPAQKKEVAVFDEKRLAAKELQTAFSKYLMSFDSYKRHMDTMSGIDKENVVQVNNFKSRFSTLFKEYRRQTQDLSYALATSQIYFSSPVRTEMNDFVEWHNTEDRKMTTLPPDKWVTVQKFRKWREKLLVSVRKEIVGDAE